MDKVAHSDGFPYIALDIETTGIHEGRLRGWKDVVQISLIAGNTDSPAPGDSITLWNFDVDWDRAEPFAANMNWANWNTELGGARRLPMLMGEVQDFINGHPDCALAGFNVGSFDRQFLPGLQGLARRHWDIGAMWSAKFGPARHRDGSIKRSGIWTGEDVAKELGMGPVTHDAYEDNLITVAAMHRIFKQKGNHNENCHPRLVP